ncbi:MAG: monovalent cation/H(+) antiporter subunit G [Pigmentiphaga sp.]|nr:monovalent cation/H(+) antiporter subunit G [Pigmentiphaga sp.]
MSLVLAVAALLLKIAGFVFLFSAALGLLRFKDPLQRMHAATKAGTVGAGLSVAGAALAHGDGLTMIVAAVTILFLVITVPLAGHLLGRAIYVSGVPLQGIEGRDALQGVLKRHEVDPSSEATTN